MHERSLQTTLAELTCSAVLRQAKLFFELRNALTWLPVVRLEDRAGNERVLVTSNRAVLLWVTAG